MDHCLNSGVSKKLHFWIPVLDPVFSEDQACPQLDWGSGMTNRIKVFSNCITVYYSEQKESDHLFHVIPAKAGIQK